MTPQQQKAFDEWWQKQGFVNVRTLGSITVLTDNILSVSNWTEFKADDETTWPKEDVEYLIQCDGGITSCDSWKNREWEWNYNNDVVAYQPLPPKFEVKK